MHTIDKLTYPGATFQLTVVAVGQRDGAAPTTVIGKFESITTTFQEFQDSQQVQAKCTSLKFTVLSASPAETMTLRARGPCLHAVKNELLYR